jgi:hypothetical protein
MDGMNWFGMQPPTVASTNSKPRPAPRLDAQPDLAELAGAAGLLLVPVMALGLGGDGLAVGDARRVRLDVDVELLGEPAHQHLQVQLAEAAHDGLVGRGVVLDVEAGVFGLELVQRVGELLLVAALGDVDGQPEQRHRALDAVEVEVVLVVGVVQHGVEVDVVDARDGEDVAGHALVDLVQLGAVYPIQVIDLERLARVADEQLRVRRDPALVDAEDADLAAERVVDDLEDVGDGVQVRVRRDLHRLACRRPRPS